MTAVSPQATRDAALRPEPHPSTDAELRALWSVELLGGLRLSDGAQHITKLPSRAVTALLARLALAPERAHAREELIELLWPGVALDVGRNRLRQALSTLKGILEPAGRLPPQPVLQADRISVRVVAGSLSCDATLRFGLYPPIREFAASRQDVAAANHGRTRLRAWALGWAQALPRTPPLESLRTEMPNLMAAMASAVDDGAPEDAIHLLLALRPVAKGYANNLTTKVISRQERIIWLAPAVRREVGHEIRTILKNNQIFKVKGREVTAFKAGGA